MRVHGWLAFACFVVVIGRAVAEPAAVANEGPAPRQTESREAEACARGGGDPRPRTSQSQTSRP